MNLEEIIKQEERYQFKEFNHSDGLKIALKIIENAKATKPKPVGIRIVYEDNLIFHYLMDGRKTAPWLNRKEKTVLESKHSSLYVFYKQEDYPSWIEDTTYAICGGGFPILINNEVKGAIIVSGLAHDEDHDLIIQALEDYLYPKNA